MKRTYVLVHGGGHGGWCWKRVARILRDAGHEVYCPTLAGLADRAHLLTPELDLNTHIREIAGLLEFEDLRDVILAGHSYGGMVITGAADRVPDRIARLVYLDAAIPHDGEALVDVSPGLLALAGTTQIVDGVELGLFPDAAAAHIYGLAGAPDEAWAMQRLTPHPWKTVIQPLRLQAPQALATLARSIVNCTVSLKGRPDAIRSRWSTGEHVDELDTGHDLMLTEPEAVGRILLDRARGLSSNS